MRQFLILPESTAQSLTPFLDPDSSQSDLRQSSFTHLEEGPNREMSSVPQPSQTQFILDVIH